MFIAVPVVDGREMRLPRVDRASDANPSVAGGTRSHVGTSPPQDRLRVRELPELVELLQRTRNHRITVARHAVYLLEARRERGSLLLKRATAVFAQGVAIWVSDLGHLGC